MESLIAGDWQVELLPAQAYEAVYAPARAVLGVAFDAQSGTHAFGSDRIRPFRAKPNGLGFVPPGCDVYSASPAGGEYLRIVEATPGRLAHLPARQFSDVIDAAAIAAAHAIRRHLLADGCAASELVEMQAEILVGRVQAILSMDQTFPRDGAWITPNRLKRIDEYIDCHMERKIRVGEIAAALGLSEGFFIRAFKAAVGVNPHGYLIDRRIAKARHLLRTSRQALVDIALAVGFSSHAHMSACFRERLGVTPSKLRSMRSPHVSGDRKTLAVDLRRNAQQTNETAAHRFFTAEPATGGDPLDRP
jgi:AraC family transcriptional regulator